MSIGEIAISVNIKYSVNVKQTIFNTKLKAKYMTKLCKINFNTVFNLVGIKLYYRNEIEGH